MSKKSSPRKYDNKWKIKNKCGKGDLETYKPWITTHEFSSKGRVSRIKGLKTNRVHYLLSDLERNYFLMMEFEVDVIDIKEQYPLLPLEETQNIADNLKIRHSYNKKFGEPYVMTTDFLIVYKVDGKVYEVARTLKYSKDLNKKRQLEKFEIERRYWDARNIDWKIVTEKEINKLYILNILAVRPFTNIYDVGIFRNMSAKEVNELVLRFREGLINKKYKIRTYVKAFEKTNKLSEGAGFDIFKHLIASRKIQVKLDKILNFDEKILVLPN